MANHPSFGRQSFGRCQNPQARTGGAIAKRAVDAPQPADRSSPYAGDFSRPAHDEELEQWKRARKQARRFPWRQLSLMASLCFGVASFVLPASVNSNVQWLLYALVAASLYAGFRKRRAGG
jgi:hypothetical protein